VLVHLPDDRKVFTGDILFIDGTPIMWAGPVANWIAACDRIMAMDADVIVPGHGPITDKAGVRRVQDYLAFCDREARKRFDAGLSVRDRGPRHRAGRLLQLGRLRTDRGQCRHTLPAISRRYIPTEHRRTVRPDGRAAALGRGWR